MLPQLLPTCDFSVSLPIVLLFSYKKWEKLWAIFTKDWTLFYSGWEIKDALADSMWFLFLFISSLKIVGQKDYRKVSVTVSWGNQQLWIHFNILALQTKWISYMTGFFKHLLIFSFSFPLVIEVKVRFMWICTSLPFPPLLSHII